MGGGHSAWKKRVARGELAKGSGGAIARHRPRLGRRGKDLILNRKGFIGGGNPKKIKKKAQQALLLQRDKQIQAQSQKAGKGGLAKKDEDQTMNEEDDTSSIMSDSKPAATNNPE
eukprot:CAMPEP_0172459532 /NCGR_PEP_ID=MMETSP1065-20121228/33043_1 /TAXON_ID=265537 /ORGANISM="Amphiprora paludosa, Strain CCMP125" /LENGTH=114 /DNA_ID=CAMNT_0013214247 /DNA_START=51 /DNA_END=395 /DNA_ORIENTATION=-